MGKNVVFIGRPATGKTCTACLISGKEQPQNYIANMKLEPETYDANDGLWFFNLGNSKISIFGGNNQNIRACVNEMINADFILYFFNGVDFLKELDNHWQGGDIGADIRNEVKSALIEYLESEEGHKEKSEKFKNLISDFNKYGLPNNFYFVATHKDQCVNMKEKILKKMNSIQQEYPGRYFFYQKLVKTLYCIDATNTEDVKQLFKDIVH